MKRIGMWIALLGILLCAGCAGDDFEVSLVVENQAAPHDGYNVGPDLWVEKGKRVPVSGALISIEGTDPNSLFEIVE